MGAWRVRRSVGPGRLIQGAQGKQVEPTLVAKGNGQAVRSRLGNRGGRGSAELRAAERRLA